MAPPARAQEAGDSAATGRLLYRSLPYGSQATFSPLTMLLNVGFEDMLSSGSDRHLFDVPYADAARAQWDGLAHPSRAIARYGGWPSWVTSEILPLELSLSAGWIPNYATHLLSGSLQTRMLTEWYAAHGAPMPRLMGSVTFLAASFLHEMVQYPHAREGAATSVADLYAFDVPAALLGHLDGPIGYLARRWDAANWASMPSPTLPGGELMNFGDYWVYKIPFPFDTPTRFFARVGYGTQFGLTHPLHGGRAVSVAFGVDTDRRTVDATTLDESVTLVQSFWLSLDRDNSLLASVNLSGRLEDRLIVNVYPGVLPGAASGLGVWLVMDADGTIRTGIAHRRTLGMGIGRVWN